MSFEDCGRGRYYNMQSHSVGLELHGSAYTQFFFSKCTGKLFGDLQKFEKSLQMNLLIFLLTLSFL